MVDKIFPKGASLEYILVFVTVIRTLPPSSSFLSKHFKKKNDLFENCIVISGNTFYILPFSSQTSLTLKSDGSSLSRTTKLPDFSVFECLHILDR